MRLVDEPRRKGSVSISESEAVTTYSLGLVPLTTLDGILSLLLFSANDVNLLNTGLDLLHHIVLDIRGDSKPLFTRGSKRHGLHAPLVAFGALRVEYGSGVFEGLESLLATLLGGLVVSVALNVLVDAGDAVVLGFDSLSFLVVGVVGEGNPVFGKGFGVDFLDLRKWKDRRVGGLMSELTVELCKAAVLFCRSEIIREGETSPLESRTADAAFHLTSSGCALRLSSTAGQGLSCWSWRWAWCNLKAVARDRLRCGYVRKNKGVVGDSRVSQGAADVTAR